MTIRSFSGAHPIRPQCVIAVVRSGLFSTGEKPDDLDEDSLSDVVVNIVHAVDAHRCPRCNEPLTESKSGSGFWMNAGSRVTRCRCIPICSRCGEHEALEGRFAKSKLGIRDWPTSPDEARADLYRWWKGATRNTGVLTEGHLLTGDGISVLQSQNTGGWREYGYCDDEDRAERRDDLP